jgi:type VI secretion system secreted protein Hcp
VLEAELSITGPDGPMRSGPGPRGGGAIPLLEVRHTLVSPRDAATGQASGKRRHAPITVVKEVDRTSPLLLHAWVRNDVLPVWKLEFFAADRLGRRSVAYTIELRRAGITEIAMTTADSTGLPREAVSFVYEAVTWTWLDGRTSTTDDWVAPV